MRATTPARSSPPTSSRPGPRSWSSTGSTCPDLFPRWARSIHGDRPGPSSCRRLRAGHVPAPDLTRTAGGVSVRRRFAVTEIDAGAVRDVAGSEQLSVDVAVLTDGVRVDARDRVEGLGRDLQLRSGVLQ